MTRWLPLLVACSGTAAPEPEPGVPALRSCAEAMAAGGEVSWEALPELLSTVVREQAPTLGEVRIDIVELESDAVFFAANLDLTTASLPPLERSYRLQANRALFADPPPFSAVYAILVHELKHVLDYTEMDTEELVSFGLWYAGGDVAVYERETDEYALEQGCAEGLKAYRVWLYDQISDEDEAGKRVDYYTPEEIDAWVSAQD